MKTTYHSNLGISDSSQVGNASSKEEKCFKIFFMYLHIGFSPTNWLVETFEVCEGETWSLGLHLILPGGRAVGTMFQPISLFSTLCVLGTVDQQRLPQARQRTSTMLQLRHAGVKPRAAS